MKKTFKILGTIMLVFLLVGCFPPTEDDLYGTWVNTGTDYTVSLYDSLRSIESDIIDHEIDDYFSALFYQFTEENFIAYRNNSYSGTFDCDSFPLMIDGDTLVIGTWAQKINYKFNGRNKFSMVSSIFSKDSSMVVSLLRNFDRYMGDIPPESWTMPLEDDNYEPDERNYAVLKVGKTQKHTLTDDDVDVFGFTPVANTIYLFQVNSNIDLNLTIENIDGHEIAYDDDNDDEIKDLEGAVESVIRWTAPSADMIYLLVESSAIGFYTINAIDEDVVTSKNSRSFSPVNSSTSEMHKKNSEIKKIIKEEMGKYFK